MVQRYSDDGDVVPPKSRSMSWKRRVPVLEGRDVMLREVELRDADVLLRELSGPEASQFITPPPDTKAGFERFIRWARRERQGGRFVCFVVIPRSAGEPVGVVQVWPLEPRCSVAEWGFVLNPRHWGNGCFLQAATLVADFVFEGIGAHRLEARAAVANERGLAALRKLGAVEEGRLRRCFACGEEGQRLDHALWAILVEDWQTRKNQQHQGFH